MEMQCVFTEVETEFLILRTWVSGWKALIANVLRFVFAYNGVLFFMQIGLSDYEVLCQSFRITKC